MDLTLAKTIDTLRTAQEALRIEVDVWAKATVVDEARLGRLRETARSCQEQAHSALVMMAYQDTPEALQEEVEALVSSFSEIVGQVEALLATGGRPG